MQRLRDGACNTTIVDPLPYSYCSRYQSLTLSTPTARSTADVRTLSSWRIVLAHRPGASFLTKRLHPTSTLVSITQRSTDTVEIHPILRTSVPVLNTPAGAYMHLSGFRLAFLRHHLQVTLPPWRRQPGTYHSSLQPIKPPASNTALPLVRSLGINPGNPWNRS
jgi:hypothetical protein